MNLLKCIECWAILWGVTNSQTKYCEKCRKKARKETFRNREPGNRLNTVVCNGNCGERLALTKGSSEYPMCHSCRKEQKLKECNLKTCLKCKRTLEASKNRKYCSKQCFIDDVKIHDSEKERYAYKRRLRRAIEKGIESERYTLSEIAERDSNLCHICSDYVSLYIPFPNPESATIDHVIPISRGGSDLKSNVKLAHWYCNLRKSAKLMEELRAS